jgi:hypothetical protein
MIAQEFDVEAFAVRVAKLQREHASRSESEGIIRSRAALRSWGERVPQSLARVVPDDLVAAHRQHWLRDAEALIQVLDWQTFANGRTAHVIDFTDLGVDADCGMLGFAAGTRFHESLAAVLPRRQTTTPAAAVAVNCTAIARGVAAARITDATSEAAWVSRVVAGIALHEYAHVVASAATDCTVPPLRLTDIPAAVESHGSDYRSTGHGAAWARGYAHLVHRARYLAGHRVRDRLFEVDMAERLGDRADAVLSALGDELRDAADDPLAEIVRSPAPPAFADLFESHNADHGEER